MKDLIKQGLDKLLKNNLWWKFLRPLAVMGSYMTNKREEILKQSELNLNSLNQIFSERKVLYGAFKGMKYFSLESVGSSLFAKLLGSYEKEISEQIGCFCNNGYTEIIDIGCAEGYYAIGFASRIPEAKVYAYDINEQARYLCGQMAKINAVEKRVEIRGFCSPGELSALIANKRALIICDCEGFEKELFTISNVNDFKNCDLLIETHDFLDINISSSLHELFAKTHTVTTIKSIDDVEKAKTYKYNETDGLDLNLKKYIFSEHRPTIMEWLVCVPK
jgi:hypothetical protein